MDVSVLREVAAHHEITARQGELLDIGGHLLPWMVAHGYPVHTFTVESMGDLGNISSYVQTLSDALCGQFPSLHPYMQEHPEAPARCYIDPTSWDMADQISGLSLREKVARKMVKLYAPLRIGRYVRIEPGVTLSTCNIDDECLVQRGASIMRSSIGEGSFIGPHSWLIDTVVGMMASIRSNAEKPVSLTASCALGDEVTLYPGVQLSNQVAVYPRMVIPTGVKLDRPTLVTSPDDLPASAYPHAPLPLPALPDFGSLGTTTTALRW
jgi:NDP-sugar pyrophosphorylase family protein